MADDDIHPNNALPIAELLHSLVVTNDPREHNRVLRELEGIGGNEVYEALLGLLDAKQGELRYRVLSTLTGVNPNRAQHLLIDVMNTHNDSDMQWAASLLLLNVANTDVLDSLTRALLNHPDARVRVTIVTVLDKLGDSRALPALRDARQHDTGTTEDGYTVRFLAERAIQGIESRSEGEANSKNASEN